jgi:ubiquinone/menaquinone biosynthesis C-methylase UbiE
MTGEKGPYSDVAAYYEATDEAGRLDVDYFPLERARTQEVIARYLPASPQRVLDVGGAAGAYAYWLAERGHEVHLVDPVAKHLRQAEAAAVRHPKPLASIRPGDARALPFEDASADAVLMLGPLYHLHEKADRLKALREAARVLRSEGWLFAAGISRFASLVDGLRTGSAVLDPLYTAIVDQDLHDGQHRNETGSINYFTTSYFHRPEELREEVTEAGLAGSELFAVEGPAFSMPDFAARWKRPAARETLLRLLRKVEKEPALMGVSPHLLVTARRT